jgi:hypothetical protein
MLIAGRKINVALLIQDMRAENIETWKISSLLKPYDAQNVACAVELILTLRRMGESWKDQKLNPSQRDRRRSLAVFGHFYGSFLEAHINPQLSLSEQLRLLSKYAHLGIILYKQAGNRLMPSQLYADSMSCVKNAFATVIKQQELDGTQRVFLTLEGSDPLEELYGIIRMMGGHNPNFDINGFCYLADGALDLTGVFARYPEWKAAIRRLVASLSAGKRADLQRIRHWIGDIIAGHAKPELDWDLGLDGAQTVNDEFEISSLRLRQYLSDESIDSLRPLGDGHYVGKDRPGKALEKDRSMEEPEPFDAATVAALSRPTPAPDNNAEQPAPVTPPINAGSETLHPHSSVAACAISSAEDNADMEDDTMSVDELAVDLPGKATAPEPDALVDSTSEASAFRDEAATHSPDMVHSPDTATDATKIMDHVFTETGRKVFKVSHINISFNSAQRHQSKERLERVQGFKSSSLAIDESPGIIASDEFAVGQLFATLMRYGDGAFLAVLECIEIRKAGVSMLANPVPRADLLIPSNNYVLRASVYGFVPTMGSETHGTQWQWAPSSHVNFRPAGKASMAHDRLDFMVPGFAAVCVAPRLEIYANSSEDGVVTWTLSGDEMPALAARVYEQVGCDLLNKLPLCGSSTVGTFPYTQLDGKYNLSLLHKRDTDSET